MRFKSVSQQNKAYLLALLAVLFWSTVSSAFKITLRYVSFDAILFWANLSGTLFLTLVIAASRPGFKTDDFIKRSLFSSALMGLINPFLYYLLLLKGYALLEAQEAAVINYVWIILLVFFSIVFLKQKIKPVGVVALFVSFAGTVVVVLRGDFTRLRISNLDGALFIFVASALFALYWIFNMKDERGAVKKIWMNLSFGMVYIFLYHMAVYHKIKIPSVEGVLGSAYIGLFEMSITFVVWLKALNHSENTAGVGNLMYLSPFLALFWINHAVGETIRISTVVGLILIISGIVLQKLYGASKEKT